MYWLSGFCIDWMDFISCIVSLDIARSGSYRLDWLDLIGWIGLDHNGWMRTHSFCKDVTDGTDGIDGLDGELVGLGWGRTVGSACQNGSATIGWLVIANKGQMGRMDLMGRWWDRGGTDECWQTPERELHRGLRNKRTTVGS